MRRFQYFLIIFILIPLFYSGCKNRQKEDVRESAIDNIQEASTSSLFDSFEVKGNTGITVDFRTPAKRVMPGVVHLISNYKQIERPQREFDIPDFFKDFFGEDFSFRFDQPGSRSLPRVGSGSGVIISQEGHIVTNNHVIKKAESVEVITHNNRTFHAEILGIDPSTDLALIKIDGNGLPFVKFGNSDEVEIGEWVLAVGNPFNLSSTVTAGIVSAKTRNINIIQDQSPIESFIQTDAAVNPGNSGGALVNISGELIGINTAISSPTGTYAGYGFAIPVNIVRKVINDILKYGEVRRAYLGVLIKNINSDIAEELKSEEIEGVYIDSLIPGGAAEKAGLKKADVITTLDGEKIKSVSRLQEIVGQHHPGDKITIEFIRKGQSQTLEINLHDRKSSIPDERKVDSKYLKILGIDISDIEKPKLKKWNIKGGVSVDKISQGKVKAFTSIKKGFIITKVNRKIISSVSQFEKAVKTSGDMITLEGIYPDAPNSMFSFTFGLS